MSFRQVYPELAKAERGAVEYGCNICKALSFQSLWEAESHCRTENKGKRRDSQWRHELLFRSLPLSGPLCHCCDDCGDCMCKDCAKLEARLTAQTRNEPQREIQAEMPYWDGS